MNGIGYTQQLASNISDDVYASEVHTMIPTAAGVVNGSSFTSDRVCSTMQSVTIAVMIVRRVHMLYLARQPSEIGRSGSTFTIPMMMSASTGVRMHTMSARKKEVVWQYSSSACNRSSKYFPRWLIWMACQNLTPCSQALKIDRWMRSDGLT